MKTVSISIGIAHAGFLPERKPGLARLLEQIDNYPRPQHGGNVHVSRSLVREHASVWAKRLWEWAATQEADAVVLLNDDVTLCPNFVQTVQAMVAAVPDQVIALHCTAPVAPSLAAAGEQWLRSYWLTGPAYILPRGAAKRLLEWVANAPKSLIASVNEDNVIMHWAWSEQRPIWHSLPALVQHDVSVPSTLGYDNHPMRQSNVAWDSPHFKGESFINAEDWAPKAEPVMVQCPWMSNEAFSRVERAYQSVPQLCCFCHARAGQLGSATGAVICGPCLSNCVNALVTRAA